MRYEVEFMRNSWGHGRAMPQDPEKKREEHRTREVDRAHAQRSRVLMFFGGKCECCGNNDSRVLQLDHVNGGGHKERRTVGPKWLHRGKGGAMTRPDEFQLLCSNCNWIKRFEQAEHGGHASLFVGGV